MMKIINDIHNSKIYINQGKIDKYYQDIMMKIFKEEFINWKSSYSLLNCSNPILQMTPSEPCA